MPTANGIETCKLVDAIGASPTTVLDLNSATAGEWYLRPQGIDIDPPPLRRSIPQTLLIDGSGPPAAAFDNRTIVLPLRLTVPAATANPEALKATRLASLAAALNAAGPVLQFQPRTSAASTFYRLFRSPSIAVDRWTPVDGVLEATATILAEPFGLGLPVTLSAATVTDDPAAGTNGCFADLTGITGDVETPAQILLTAGGNNMAPILAVRRHGTPSDLTLLVQCETATLGTDTTSTGSLAAMSGSTAARVSFATNAAMATRVTARFPITSGVDVDARGTFRLLVMVASTTTTAVYALRQRITPTNGATDVLVGDTVTYTPTDTGRYLIDLGLFQVPAGVDPVRDGYGAALAVGSLLTQIQAQRVSGTGSLDLDFAAALPADEELCRLGTVFALDTVLDGPTDKVFYRGGSGEVLAAGAVAVGREGSIPMLTPAQTNRLFLLRPDGLGTGYARGPSTKTRTTTVTVKFWPRYLTWAA